MPSFRSMTRPSKCFKRQRKSSTTTQQTISRNSSSPSTKHNSTKKVRDFQKQLKLLKKMRKLLITTKEPFAHPADLLETQFALISCLDNLKKYDQVIKIGSQGLKCLQTKKSIFLKPDFYQHLKSNIIACVGYAYFQKVKYDTALEHFERSEQIFTQIASNPNQLMVHSIILRKISQIYMQVKKDFTKACFYLEKNRQLILNEKSMPLQKKLIDLAALLLDHKVKDQQYFEKLIKVGYIDRINRVVDGILQVTKTIAATPQSKLVLQPIYILIDSINQIYNTFATSQQYDKKANYAIKARNLLKEMIQTYENVFTQEVKQVQEKTFKGDETLGQIIDRALNLKKELEKNQ